MDPEASGRRGSRIAVTLACGVCKARNYKTTRQPELGGAVELKKYCKHCKQHTIHRETK